MDNADDRFSFVTAENDKDLENLITALFHRCRVSVTSDDPMMVMYYTVCYMAGRLEVAARQAHDEANRSALDLAEKVNADATEKAESIVNGAIKASESIVSNAIRDSASAIRTESAKALADFEAIRGKVEESVLESISKIKYADTKTQKTARWALMISALGAMAGIAALLGVAFR